MTRSRKRTPVTGVSCAESDKDYKKAEHQRERSAVKVAVQQGGDPPPARAFGNPWQSEKDGKHYWHADQEKALRK